MSIFSVGGSTPAASDAVESKSIRLDRSSTAYLKKAFPFSTNKKTWTFSCWSKRADVATGYQQGIFASDTPASPGDISGLDWWDSGALCWRDWRSGSTNNQLITTALYRDPAAWYHIVVAYDTTQATASNRIKMYVNGEQVTDFSTANYPSQNYEGAVNYGTSSLDRLHGIGHNTGFNDSSSQYIAEVNFIDGTALGASYFGETDSSTNQWKPKAAEDIKAAVTFGEHGFYLPFSNDALNTSFVDTGNGGRQTVTAVGNVHTDTTIKKFGTASAQFDGTGDAITSADNADYTFGAGQFTLEAYVYLGATDRQVFISKYDESGNSREFKWEYDSNNMAFGYSTNGTSNTWLNFSWTPSTSTWYHIAVCRDGVGNIRAYVDGTQIGTTQAATGTFHNGSAILSIGANIHNGSVFNSELTGYMDEIRISNTCRYPANFTAPTSEFEGDTNTILLLHCNGSDGGTTFLDSAPLVVTASGDVKNVRVLNNPVGFSTDGTGGQHIAGPKIGTGCFASTSSSGNYLSVADSADWTFGTGDFTLEAWCNLDDNDENAIFSQYADASNRWYLTVDNRDNVQTVAMYHAASGLEIETNASSGAFGVHKWVHLAAVRASGVITIYVDGVAQTLATNTSASANMTDVAAALQIGAYNGGDTVKGYLDEVRVSNSARYTSNFTPSTTAFSNDSNTKLLLHCDGTHGSTTFTDSSSGTHSVTANGNTRILAPKIGTGVNRTNGGDNGIYIPGANCPWAEFGTGDFTVEAWVSLDDITTDNQQFFTHRNSVNSGDWVFWWDATNGLQWSGSNNTLSQGGTTGWASNTWVHIAASRASGVNKIFVNGTVVATNSSATQDYSATASLFIASYSTGTGSHNSSGGNITGFMDEVRITPGKALYTGNFTPSTTAYTDDIDTRLLLHFDGGGPGTAGTDTNIGQGQYYHDSSTNAIFYEDNLPKYKSYINFDGSGDYLTATGTSTPTDRGFDFVTGAFAIEFWFWVKDSNAHTALVNSANYYVGGFNGNWAFDCYQEDVRFNMYNGTGSVGSVDSTGGKIECGVWNHVAFCRDGSGNSRIFINGELSSSVSTVLNGESLTDGSYGVEFGGNISYAGPGDLNGGMDNIRISNSARYTSAFTKPTDRLTSDSDTVFLLNSDFTDGGIGADHSGNYNYFTLNNLGTEDIVEDSPTNNFATLNPLWMSQSNDSSRTFAEGNLKASTSSSNWKNLVTTQNISSGKWYWECVPFGDNFNWEVGVCRSDWKASSSNIGPESAGSYCIYCSGASSGGTWDNGSYTAHNRDVWAANDILMVAYDDDTGKFWLGKNGTWFNSGDPASGSTPLFTVVAADRGDIYPIFAYHTNTAGFYINTGADSSFAGQKTAQGNQDGNDKGDFYYTPPTGFIALCTDNLDTPNITDPTDHFKSKLYTGTGSELAVTGIGFQPDFTWIKTRQLAYNHRVFDVNRGVTKELYTNGTNAEVTDAQSLKSFDSDGFTLGTSSGVNPSADNNMVSWNWKAGGAAVSNTDGSITSSVSANTDAGFSIITFQGNATQDATIGHGLSQAPEIALFFNRPSSSNEPTVWAGGITGTYNQYLYLSETNAVASSGFYFGTSGPMATASTLKLGTSARTNTSSSPGMVCYAFHSVDGYSKVGSYTGNGAADGTFIYTGFRPAFVMTKSSSSTGNWTMLDNAREPTNVSSPGRLYADLTNTESDGATYDFVSNGFKCRETGGPNNSGVTYIYIAFAESPFKTANAR